MAKESRKFFVHVSMYWIGIFLEQHELELLKGFSQQNLRTGEELVLTRLSTLHFSLRRCPIGTEEKEWRPIAEEMDNRKSWDQPGKIEIIFKDIGFIIYATKNFQF